MNVLSGRNARRLVSIAIAVCAVWAATAASAGQLLVGAATADITPPRPAALDGQFQLRVSKGVDNPLLAAALALESRGGDGKVEQAIIVSCDLVAIRPPLMGPLRQRLQAKLPDFDAKKLILAATHTHTAPVTEDGKYNVPTTAMQPAEYVDFLLGQLESAIVAAWQSRKPGSVAWGLGHAVVGQNRRAVYEDGKAVMYGATDKPTFRGIEAGEDHALELLYFFQQGKSLPVAVAVNVACPSQEVESRSTLNADFWHCVRQRLEGPLAGAVVLGLPGASGDISPHHLYRKAAEERMAKLRGHSSVEEIGRRIAAEVVDVFNVVRGEARGELPFAHVVQTLALPVRKVTEEEVAESVRQAEAIEKKGGPQRLAKWHRAVGERFEQQGQQPTYEVEIHVLRLGDVAIATNPFELFGAFGLQMKARSKALQTLVVQLCGAGSYLATQQALAGGGYSAVVQSTKVGPEGGQALVEATVAAINRLFEPAAR